MIELSKRSAASLISVVREFRPGTSAYFRPYGVWRQLDNNRIWMIFLYQVVVAGGSGSQGRLEASSEARRLLRFTALRTLGPRRRAQTVHRLFRQHGVRYARADCSKCLKTKAVVGNLAFLDSVTGGPKGYLRELAKQPERDRAERIARDFHYIKLKGSRDLLGELGLARNVIAFDVRLLNVLRLAGVAVAKDVQANEAEYRALQEALLRQVCRPARVTGIQLDRILFNNYDAIKDRLAGGGIAKSDA